MVALGYEATNITSGPRIIWRWIPSSIDQTHIHHHRHSHTVKWIDPIPISRAPQRYSLRGMGFLRSCQLAGDSVTGRNPHLSLFKPSVPFQMFVALKGSIWSSKLHGQIQFTPDVRMEPKKQDLAMILCYSIWLIPDCNVKFLGCKSHVGWFNMLMKCGGCVLAKSSFVLS